MRRINRLLRQVELHFLIFTLGLVSLNWPILNIFDGKMPESIIVYFFSIWALVILILFLVQRACGTETSENTEDEPL